MKSSSLNSYQQSIETKITNKEWLNAADGLELYNFPLAKLGVLANEIKEERFKNHISFIKNYYINLTNICQYACKYCAFRRNATDSDAYTLTIDQVIHKIASAPEVVKEAWFSNGLNKNLPFSFHKDLLLEIKKAFPSVQIKAYTAVEIDFFSKLYKKPVEEIIEELIACGLDRIPGGGAEIFDDAIRKKIDIKTRPTDYLYIHSLFHKHDIPTGMTMLFGHVEERIHRINHMITIREFQEKSKGVQAFIPLAFQDQNNPLAKRGVSGPSSVEILKTLAISRIMLNNVDHIQSFWIDSGVEITQISMHFGVDDINGSMIEENIAHESGSKTKKYESTDSLMGWIYGGGCIPVERDTRFKTIAIHETQSKNL